MLILIGIFIGMFWTAGILLAQPPTPQLIPQNQANSYAGSLSLSLKRFTPDKLEQALRQIFGTQFVSEGQNQYGFSVNRNNLRRQCSLRIEPQSNQVILSGNKQLCEQLFLLIAAIDQPPQQGRTRQVVPYQQYVKPDILAKMFDSCRIPKEFRAETAPSPSAGSLSPNAVRLADHQFQNPANSVRLVDYQFQEAPLGSGGVNSAVPMPGGNGTFGFQQTGNPTAVDVINDFQYRILADLDAVILEGDVTRINRIIEMIRQIEELSKIAEPKIEMVYLKHINCVSFGQLIAQGGQMSIYSDIFSRTPGNVRITPMITPNAVLLIGWGEALKVARDLVESLDQPVAVENSRLHIFKLKHISANQARAALAGTFPALPSTQPGNGFMARITLFPEPRSNALIVQAAPNDLEQVKQVLSEIDVPSAVSKLQVKPIKLKHTLAPDTAQTLTSALTAGTTDGKFPALELLIQDEKGQRLIQSGILSDVSVRPDARNNVIIVTAPEGCMAFIEELVVLLDIASPEAEIKIFQIEHGSAESLVAMLQKLIPSNVEGTPGPQLPGAAGEETLIPIRFAVDQRSNCIVAAGSPGDLKIVEALLKSIDREDLLSRKEQVYFLKSMKAADVAATIEDYITRRRRVQQEAPGVISPYQQIESEVIVVAHKESNSLIISATPKYYDEIIKLIQEIDKSPPQVVIKVLIAEVTLSEDKEWAAELGFQDPLMFSQRGGKLLFNSGNGSGSLGDGAGAPGTVGTQMLSNFNAGRVGQAGFGGLAFSASSDYLNIMLRALHEKKRLEILSSPQITAINNQLAMVHIGQDMVIATGGSINPQTGAIQMNTTPKEVGLVLTVTPNISPEGTIVMSILAKKSKVGPEQEGTTVAIAEGNNIIRAPKIDVIDVGTVISAANNETVVLGGLLTKEENKIRRKVPLLGDIPILGKMFRQEIDQTIRKELLVILTPRIVQDQNDMEQVKQMEFARMNWCLNNVVQVHGDLGAYSVVAERPYIGNTPVMTPGPIKMEDLEPIIAPTLPTPVLPKKD